MKEIYLTDKGQGIKSLGQTCVKVLLMCFDRNIRLILSLIFSCERSEKRRDYTMIMHSQISKLYKRPGW